MRARDVQMEIFRRMTPGERWAAAERLYWSARRLKAAHLRAIHPDWSDDEVERAVREAFMHVRG
jgi:hypothetical protein